MSNVCSATILPRHLKIILTTSVALMAIVSGYAEATVPVTDSSARYSVLHSFDAVNDGSDPYEVGVSLGKDGSLYGTALSGGKLPDGSYGSGTVYKIKPSGEFKVLHVFDGIAGGAPTAAVTQGPDGSIYGTTQMGGRDKFNSGVVYKIDATGKYSVIHGFNFNTEGKTSSEVVLAANGSLYGTTYKYGTGVAVDPATIYKIDANGKYNVIHHFNQANQELPVGSLHLGLDGNLYGATVSGKQATKGSVYKISPNGAYRVVHTFNSAYQGSPNTGVNQAKDGSLYGTTSSGGIFGRGTVYKIDSAGKYQILHHFDGINGFEPRDITLDADGNVYGVAATVIDYYYFVDNGPSIAFKIGVDRSYSILYAFNSTGGQSKLMRTNAGSLYGTERLGGKYEGGKVFRIKFVPPALATLTVDNVLVRSGQPLSFKVNVAGNQPTGVVTFLLADGGVQQLFSAILNGGVATYTNTNLKPGRHTFIAQYYGDNLNAGSISKPVVVTISP